MVWDKDSFKWIWFHKHEPLPKSKTWKQMVEATEDGGPSLFAREFDRPAVISAFRETLNDTEGHGFINQTCRQKRYYFVLDFIVGASCGETTRIVKVRWDDGCNEAHGYPITETELLEELKKDNRPEFDHYNSIWRP